MCVYIYIYIYISYVNVERQILNNETNIRNVLLRTLHSDVCSYVTVQGLSLPLAARKLVLFITACRKEAKASSPLPLTGPFRSEGATLANRLAASRNHTHPWTISSPPSVSITP